MVKRTLPILTSVLLLRLMIATCHSAEENPSVNSKNPEMRDIKTINSLLDSYIAKNDKGNVEKLMAYTQERSSKYALLLMVEFYEALSSDKLETVKQEEPERWQVFQMYLNKTLAWLFLTRKADDFLGGHLESTLKATLEEK